VISAYFILLAAFGQAVPPGTSPEHWTTRSVLAGFAGAGIIFVIAALMWKSLLRVVHDNPAPRILVYAAEAGTVLSLGIIASAFDIFKRATYKPTPDYHPDWYVVVWGCVWSILAALYAVFKLCAIWTRESEDFKSKKLSEELEKETAARTILDRQRTLLVKITNFANELVGKKIERLCALRQKDEITVAEFVEQLNPKRQIHLGLKLIHEFFKKQDQNGAVLRLAVWMHDTEKQADRLSIAYCWDGERENCFSNRSSDRMKLINPGGTKSEVVSCYHSQPRTIKIIPNCEAAVARGEFTYFYPEQRDKIASMVLYKHVFRAQPSAVVLLLVSSKADNFAERDADEIGHFLDEMLTRIEMESIVLDLARKVA
jgi:hypothetical protein